MEETKTINKKRLTRILAITLGVLVLLGLIALLLVNSVGKASVHFLSPDGEEIFRVLKGSALPMPPGPEQEGYVFLGWQNEQGDLERRESIVVREDSWFAAEYAVALLTEEHPAYLFADEQGFYRPDAPMTRADAALMLHTLLAAPVKAGGNFIDVAKNAPYAEATAALRELGVVTGSRFHPEETITRRELLGMLSAFCPAATEQFSFQDLPETDPLYPAACAAAQMGWIDSGKRVKLHPDETMTRLETAQLMNAVTGRAAQPSAKDRQVGAPVDLYPDAEGYWDMIEAVVPHSFDRPDDGSERWTDSEPVKKLPQGVRLVGTQLSCIGKDGRLLRNADVGLLHFDENGTYTSGSPALDEEIQKVLQQVLTEDMTEEERLRAIYDYTRDSFTYLRRLPFADGDTSWLLDEAYAMLTQRKGNCYSYASVFCMLARAIGYDAVIYSGRVGANYSPHAWVEIDFGDGPRIFDTELEMAHRLQGSIYSDYYNKSYQELIMWGYVRFS